MSIQPKTYYKIPDEQENFCFFYALNIYLCPNLQKKEDNKKTKLNNKKTNREITKLKGKVFNFLMPLGLLYKNNGFFSICGNLHQSISSIREMSRY